jgi:thymidylate synthase ThyX
LFPVLYDMLQANWGDHPSATAIHTYATDGHVHSLARDPFGWELLSAGEQAYVDKAFAGGTLPQALEMITFTFCIDGVTRAFTHQNVRTRIGAGFMQHGGRDNDWRHRDWTMPETIRRAISLLDEDEKEETGRHHCLANWQPLVDHCHFHQTSLGGAIKKHLEDGKELYAALVDSGIPYQDARRLLPIGTQTYIHDYYTYPALKGVLANRLEHIMDWEHNCVAQLMLRELNIYCPPIMTKYLGSHSDKAGKAMFAGLDSWPPDGKYPVIGPIGETFHRPEQNPYWVLSPASMAGGPVEWIWTNGTYPHDRIPGLR